MYSYPCYQSPRLSAKIWTQAWYVVGLEYYIGWTDFWDMSVLEQNSAKCWYMGVKHGPLRSAYVFALTQLTYRPFVGSWDAVFTLRSVSATVGTIGGMSVYAMQLSAQLTVWSSERLVAWLLYEYLLTAVAIHPVSSLFITPLQFARTRATAAWLLMPGWNLHNWCDSCTFCLHDATVGAILDSTIESYKQRLRITGVACWSWSFWSFIIFSAV